MGDEIDFDDLLADAEQEDQLYDDDGFMDDIEAELAMEAEVRARCFNLYVACPHFNCPLRPPRLKRL